MKKVLVALAVAAVGSVIFSMPAMAAPISITNPSFEVEDLAGIGAITGWINLPGSGTFRPSAPGTDYTLAVPHGTNVAFNNRGSISQVLSVTLAADTIYNLSVEFGNRIGFDNASGLLELRADGVTLASTSASSPEGQFSTVSLSYSTVLSDPIGKDLEIWLIRTAGSPQANWDNVQLAAVPAPSAMLLFGSGLAGLAFWRLRGKQTV